MQASLNKERPIPVFNGWIMLMLLFALLIGNIVLLINIAAGLERGSAPPLLFFLSILFFPVLIILMVGFFTLQPNEARVLVLFGKYAN